MRRRLLLPGPVEPYEEILDAFSRPVASPRSAAFRLLMQELEEGLLKLAGLGGGAVVLSGSGTLATEAMIYSLVEPGERVVVISYGEFGERLAESASRRGVSVHTIRKDPGDPLDPGQVEETILSTGASALILAHVETSTGHRISELGEVARRARRLGALVLVDAVSSLGGEDLRGGWGLDAVASCSQKALAAPPGASFVILSPEGVERLERVSRRNPPPRYMDLGLYVKRIREGSAPFTPAVNIYQALHAAVQRILRIGVEKSVEEHRRRAEILYRGLSNSLIQPLVGSPGHRANTVAVFKIPDWGPRSSEIVSALEEQGYAVATGMGRLAERVIRIGTMGNIALEDLESSVSLINKIISRLQKPPGQAARI